MTKTFHGRVQGQTIQIDEDLDIAEPSYEGERPSIVRLDCH